MSAIIGIAVMLASIACFVNAYQLAKLTARLNAAERAMEAALDATDAIVGHLERQQVIHDLHIQNQLIEPRPWWTVNPPRPMCQLDEPAMPDAPQAGR